MDNMTKRQRSRTMSKIRSKETRPEKMLRSALHRSGIRFRKNVKSLPGTPDIVMKRFKTVILVNGCFWHQHPECSRAVMPKSNVHYWKGKLQNNIERDKENCKKLRDSGWRVVTVWECEIKDNFEAVVARAIEMI